MSESHGTWLTQEAHDRLAAELAELSTTGRVDIAQKIEAARSEGDLKENAGYHAAKEVQGKMEARIRHLTDLLEHAHVGNAPESEGKVVPGTLITAVIAGDETEFIIGSREIAGHTDLDVFSDQSPLGAAILGLEIGQSTSYTAPNGREIRVEILGVETWTGA